MKKVLVNFIQDRSGSMQSVWAETLSGFKAFVKDLRDNAEKDGVEYLFSLTTFDTQIDTPIIAKPIAEVDDSILAKFGPRGSTALYDAVGTTLKNTEDDRHGAEKIIVVVVTDGQENSSREWSKDRLHQVVEAKLNAGDWTFTYLGTQPETWDDAGAIGVSRGSAATYMPTQAKAAYATTSHAVRSLSASMHGGSRSLLADFAPEKMAHSAGMKVDYDSQSKWRKPADTQTPAPVPPDTATTSPAPRRWS